VFVQPEFSSKMAETVARELDGVVVPLDPLAKNYVANLDEMAARIKTAVEMPPALGAGSHD
jgi:zinc transport system substrate-binding protein